MIQRAFLAVINYDHKQAGMLYAWKKAFDDEVGEFDYLEQQRRGVPIDGINRHFIQAASAFRPDWIWLQLQDTNVIDSRSIEAVKEALPKCVVTHWTGDCRRNVSPYLSSICGATHLTFVSSVGQLPMFRAAGAKEAYYCQIGLDWEEDVLGIPEWTPDFRIPDVVFCGTYYGTAFPGTADRVDAVRTLQGAGIDVGIVGTGWPSGLPVVGKCGVKQQHHVWKRAKVGLNINNFNDIERYYSDRQIISMASGTPVVCKYVPGLEKEFRNGEHCFWYRNLAELVDKVGQLLDLPDLAKAVGSGGKAEVMRNHTWEHRIVEVLPHVERVAKELGN